MTCKNLLDAFGDIDPKIIHAAAPHPRQNRSRNLWIRMTAVAACMAMVLSIGFANGWFQNTVSPDTTIGDFVYPDRWENMVTGSAVSDNTDLDSADVETYWEGFPVSYWLWEELQKEENDDKIFALTITERNKAEDDFTYNGMSVQDYNRFMQELEEKHNYLWKKLREFEKAGLWLCWGETLYTTGIPEDVPIVGGQKFSEELYWEEVAYYGQDMIDTYTQNNTLLIDKLQADAYALEAEIEQDEQIAVEWRRAYDAAVSYELFETLREKGYCAWYVDYTTYLFATKQELKDMKIEHKDYYLDLARRDFLNSDQDIPATSPDVPDVVQPLPDAEIPDTDDVE